MRRFYAQRGILSQPETLRHYRFAAMPAYLAPLTWLGVPDDLTSPARCDEDAVRYIREPSPALPYFERAKALDPRTAIVHEGVHAQQLALSWRHPDPIRRHYYDSAPNEGIASYNEELMLAFGLFDDASASAEFIVNCQWLRALRVELDIGLPLGGYTLDQAAERLAAKVPMDPARRGRKQRSSSATRAKGSATRPASCRSSNCSPIAPAAKGCFRPAGGP